MAKNKTYDEDFKKMVVELYENHTATVAEIIREYGIGNSTLYKWVDQYGKIKTSDGEITNNKEIKKMKKVTMNIVKKAGCVLVNLREKKIALVLRRGDYSFPKGHLEEMETIKECAKRETIEETGHDVEII